MIDSVENIVCFCLPVWPGRAIKHRTAVQLTGTMYRHDTVVSTTATQSGITSHRSWQHHQRTVTGD